MSSEAERINPVTYRAVRAVLLVLVVIAAMFAMAERAEAKGVPTQVIIFTDKKIYEAWQLQISKTGSSVSGGLVGTGLTALNDLQVNVSVVVVDDDGNLMRGLTLSNFTGKIDDVERQDHWDKATSAYHHAITYNPSIFYNNSLSFNDNGQGADRYANDGIYTANGQLQDVNTTIATDLKDDSVLLNITVNFTYGAQVFRVYDDVIVAPVRCHQALGTSGFTHSTHALGADPGWDPCTGCHVSYMHLYSDPTAYNQSSKIVSQHFYKWKPPQVSPVDVKDKDWTGWSENLSEAANGGVAAYWGGPGDGNFTGANYCYFCHFDVTGGDAKDLGDGDRSSTTDVPSCGKASVTLTGGTTSCHASGNTVLEGTSLTGMNWTWAQTGYGIGKKTHNHTSPANNANVSCNICHRDFHAVKLPNGTGSTSINQQCTLCHNITGGLNITANGGTNVAHDGKTDCKACHMDNNLKLDSHLVPTAGTPGANCTNCHDLGGKASYHVDYNTFNKSDYVHNQYNLTENKRPLNFNATNGSAARPAENKICWGCHGDDPNNDGRANFSEQPSSDHPSKYKNPRTCEQCHQNSSSPWEAPQNVAHSNNTQEVRTPGAQNCYDCHGQPVNYNNSQQDPDYNNSLKATLAYHYGRGFPAQKALRGTDGYCTKYCHQNTSSPFKEEFSSSENMQRPNHSARTSRLANQSCIADACHAAEELHGSSMKKPTLASGTFNNTACTASGCHNVSDSPYIDYKFHNGVVNCTSCHMDNKGANIHPVKYLQSDGVDFAQVNTTAASCKLCHKNSQGDATLTKWGVVARKVGAQHHSEDAENGSKWNKTIDPYWDYIPHEVTFVTGWKNNSNRGFISNFGAMQDTNYSAARISENTTADSYVGSHPTNRNFASSASGWSASGVATTLAWSGLAEDGNPAGGITVASITKSQIVDTNWTAAFTYPRSGAVAEGLIKLDSKLVKATNINTGALKVINVSIDDNAGNVTEVYNRSLPNTAEPDWSESGELSIPSPNTVFWKNGVYNVTLRARWTGLGGSSTPDIKLAYDNVFVNISEVDYKKYNFTLYINNTAASDKYTLVVGYQTHTEPARLYVLNGSSFQYRSDLSSGAFTKAIIPLSKQEYGTGNVALRINDSSSANDVDVHADYIDIEYMFIESYRWVNNSRVHYPCEYCHASNKHFEHALGIPYEFKGSNDEGQNVNSTTTWCASCHYQGYSSGTENYNDMLQAFKNHNLAVPPEITGNTTYGANSSQSPDYYEHSGMSSYNDSYCWNCHKGTLAEGSNSTVFLHNVSKGTSGGRNCTQCHNTGGSASGMLVNFTSVNKSMHASLNRNATGGNASNKPCWGCHGTKNGTWANETDQPLTDHNATYKASARKCHDCHNDTNPLFNAKPVTDHIPYGLSPSTDVNTSSYNKTYCAYCHNSSIGASFDPDDLGSNPMNASSAHYGANKTANKLMSAANNSTDCNYCHKNTSNMLKWGILQGSLSNISNKNGTAGTGYNHNAYTQSSQCYTCHGGTVANFHVPAMSPGVKGNPNCTSCHNVSAPGSYAKVDFTAINISIHGSLNNKSTSSAGNVTNKPCWGCHGTKNGSYANESDQPANDHNNTYKSSPRKCEDCHINGTIQFTAPGLTEHIMPGKNASTEMNVTEGYCSVCHNNSITSNSDSDGMGILSVINASSAHYAKEANANLMTTSYHSDNCTYCHFVNNGSSAWLTPRKPLTSTHSSYSNSTQPSTCWGCHVDSQGEPATFHVQAINKGAGSGPDCRSCHNTSDASTGRGHIDGNVFNTSIHGSMNTTGGVDLNEPCWGCHGSGESDGHNSSRYRNPYNCSDCHLSTGIRYSWAAARGALTVAEHYTSGTDIKASYNATSLYSCLKCHQDMGEMRLANGDTDANKTSWTSGGDNYNATIGGNNSPYHYGKKRGSEMRSGANTTCSYCHQNSSTAFSQVMLNAAINKSISEHSDTGTKNITGRACTDAGCHNAGFIHNSSLTKPAVQVFTSGKYDYCAPCHKESGISTKKIRGHNTSNISIVSMDCSYCHNVSSQGQASSGALRVHSTKLTNKSTANTTCAACHRDATYVPASRVIKTHYPGAATDKGNTTESERTCELCHGEVAANELHQVIVKKPAAYNCSNCHLNGSKTSLYNATTAKASINSFQHDNASHAASNQTTCERCHNTTNKPELFHFTDYANGTSVAPGWPSWTNGTQANCIDCHRNKTNQAPFYALFSASSTHTTATLDGCYNCHADVPTHNSNPKALHYVVQAPGSANCTQCHDLAGEASKKVDVAAMNRSDSIHLNLNRNATVVKAVLPYANESKRCWACHGNGTEPSGHPANYKNAYRCADCHVPSGSRNTNYTPNNTILNVTEHYRNGSDIKTSAAAYCTNCHNKTEMLKANSDTSLSAVNPANDSVSHYGKNRSGIRSGANTSCSYCHQNSTTAFENVMLSIGNKSIYEHTDAGTRNTSAGNCTGSKCHSSGFIHNSTLTKPSVQSFTGGSKDYCAPCHKVSDSSATKYVYAHNTSNISMVSMDCGYCHNSSSQGAVSSGALKLHTGGITSTSTSNSTCVTCHKDSKYVGTRVIRTHYPGASAGKANTSLSTWDCEECHGWSLGTKMHSSGLIKKPNYDCNACHNASGTSPYKANSLLFVNVTRHDNASHNASNTINCNWCHNNTNRLEPFHFTNWSNGTVEAPGWVSWTNGTRANCTECHVTYSNAAPFYAELSSYPAWHKGNYGSTLDNCYQCHSNLSLLNSSDAKAPAELHNVTRTIDWSNCNACHANKYGGAPKVDNTSLSAANSMHGSIDGADSSSINPACKACHGGNVSVHKNSSANNCTYCHIAGRIKYGAKNVSEHILNGTYANTTVNTSRYQQVFCSDCHNNSLASFNDDSPGTRNATAAHYGQNRSANKLMSSSVNSTDCIYCHKNSSNMAAWFVNATSNANISKRGDHNSYSASTQCYECHVDSKARPPTFHAEELNQGVGSNPNCINCHNIGSGNKKVDFSITNDSSNIHRNLNSGASAGSYDSANKPCWACHGNGTATAHIDTAYKSPRICESCHINASLPYNAPQVSEHYRNGSEIKATSAANNTRSCLACHQNLSEMLLSNNDNDAGSFDADGDNVNGTNISAYHYGKKRTELRSGVNTSCSYCHQNSSSVFPITAANRSIYEHTNATANITNASLTCTGSKCHATGFIHNSTLTKPKVQAWTSGKQDYCAPCHRAGDTNATKYVYSHNTTSTSINEDCGYCHNASSQGTVGSAVKIHTSGLTNNTNPAAYGSCTGCHNGTALYVGAGKQILSHLPNASQYRGNTSMSNYGCKDCHNLSGKTSMHSTGMNRSNGNCDTCHFTRTSPFKSTKKIIASNDYNHTYAGQQSCAITQCHNASNGSVFHMDKYAAGVVAEPEKFNGVWNDRTTMGFTDTPYVDCIDCHREFYNNSYPFNNTYPFNYSKNDSYGYEAGRTGQNNKIHSTSDLISSCYNCHTNRTDAANRYMVHNVTIEPLEGGPACIKCHNVTAPVDGFPSSRVNHTALNQSVHRNLTNYTAWNDSQKPNAVLLDSACWTCHATNIADIPSNSHPDRGGPSSGRAFQCTECHTVGGNVSSTNPPVYQNATRIYKHYGGKIFTGSKAFNSTKGCFECHRNGLLSDINVSYGAEYLYKNEANLSHYGNRSTLIDTRNSTSTYGCTECHEDGETRTNYGNATIINPNHNLMGVSPARCQKSCHNSDPGFNVTLHSANMGIYIGTSGCYSSGCHTAPGSGGRRKR